MSFLLFLVGFLEKWTKKEKSGQLRKSFATEKVLAAARDPLAATKPRGKVGLTSGSPRRSYYSHHEKCCVLFCSAIPLFQGLLWENLMSL